MARSAPAAITGPSSPIRSGVACERITMAHGRGCRDRGPDRRRARGAPRRAGRRRVWRRYARASPATATPIRRPRGRAAAHRDHHDLLCAVLRRGRPAGPRELRVRRAATRRCEPAGASRSRTSSRPSAATTTSSGTRSLDAVARERGRRQTRRLHGGATVIALCRPRHHARRAPPSSKPSSCCSPTATACAATCSRTCSPAATPQTAAGLAAARAAGLDAGRAVRARRRLATSAGRRTAACCVVRRTRSPRRCAAAKIAARGHAPRRDRARAGDARAASARRSRAAGAGV